MIYGSCTDLDDFTELRLWFAPYHELATRVQQIYRQKRKWLDCPLSEIVADDVEALVAESTKTIKRL
jgi:dynein heavy chain